MSLDVSLVHDALVAELAQIGVSQPRVKIEQLDHKADALLVCICSSAFEGSTYLDREMRVRPAVARALTTSGHARAVYTLELLSPDEEIGQSLEQEEQNISTLVSGISEEERANRRLWREQKAALVRALEASNYEIDFLEEGAVFIASKEALSSEKILIGLAQSVTAKTVDLGIRRSLQTAKLSQRFSAIFYITPSQLEAPFANQARAEWLHLRTTVEFLHVLNKSDALAGRLAQQSDAELERLASEHRGPIIEPTVHKSGKRLEMPFFEYIKEWAAKSNASFLVLMAPAGHGKTTLALELTRRFATAFKKKETSQVPLFVPFESVRRTVDFEALMHKRLAQLRGGAFGAFAELLRSNNAILLVDGFDELADDAGTGVAENQVRSMRALVQGKAKVVLAGRSAFAQQFAGGQAVAERVRALLGEVVVETLEIQPFDPEQIQKYVSTRQGLNDVQKMAIVDFMDASPDHEELSGNPLFLRLICSLAASGRLPSENEGVAAGVNLLIDKVCEREEERQHLGIGVERQVEFLGWVANEIFQAGGVAVAQDDARVLAEGIVESVSGASTEIVGRLLDHAFLTSFGENKLTFIHPFVRDVLIGRSIKQHVNKEKKIDQRTPALSMRDLSEGTIQYISRQAFDILDVLPNGWLSEASRLNTQTRRNLFRIATASSRYRNPDDPRRWIQSAWVFKSTIRGINMSALSFESLSFVDLVLNECDFESVLMEDCDFMGTRFLACDLSYALLVDCRSDGKTDFTSSQFVGLAFRVGNEVLPVSDWAQVQPLLSQPEVAGDLATSENVDVASVCSNLLQIVLSQLVDLDPVKFHRKTKEQLRAKISDNREQLALDKVLIPMVISSFCEIEMVAGSKELVTLAKHWRNAIVKFLRKKKRTPLFDEIFRRMVARVARYF